LRRIVVHMTQTMHRSDQDLQATVADELLYTPSIDTNLTVTVNDGAVTLAGDVGSVPERLAARQAAERVWGVKVVADKMVVRSAGASGATDTDLVGAASHMLDWSIDVPSDTVTVEIRDRMLTLSGAVTWDFQREAAMRAVSYIRGITGVNNNISLTENASVSVIKGAVEAAIRRNAPLDAQAITVEVSGHELTLNGSVRSSAERQQAEHVAWAAAGVAKVKNNLFITS
jgi:osmotically-inducible protein OsmY